MKKEARVLMVDIISALFVLLFVYAALNKIQDFEKFKVDLGKSPIIGGFATFIAYAIPALEFLIAILIVMKRYQLFALFASYSLMLLFSLYIITILKFSPYIPCSCGGILQTMTWNQHLVFNLAFVLFSIVSIIIYPEEH